MVMRVWIAAVLVCAAVAGVAAQDWEREWRERGRNGVHVRIGRDYHLPADQVASRPVVIVGGSATIDGRVEDDIVVIGGSVRIGPVAKVRANIVSLGGDVRVAETAEVQGEIREVGVDWPEIRFAVREFFWGLDEGWWAGVRLAGTIVRFAITLVAACLLALVAPGWIRRIRDRAADAPLASGVIGLAGELLIGPAVLLVVAGLVLTIVGIPLLVLVPFALLAFGVTWLAGFAGVAAQLGGLLRGRRPSVAGEVW